MQPLAGQVCQTFIWDEFPEDFVISADVESVSTLLSPELDTWDVFKQTLSLNSYDGENIHSVIWWRRD